MSVRFAMVFYLRCGCLFDALIGDFSIEQGGFAFTLNGPALEGSGPAHGEEAGGIDGGAPVTASAFACAGSVSGTVSLAEGATLEFTDDPADYLPAVPSSWEGLECLNYSPLVYAFGCTNVALCGKGVLRPRMAFWKKLMNETATDIQGARRVGDTTQNAHFTGLSAISTR